MPSLQLSTARRCGKDNYEIKILLARLPYSRLDLANVNLIEIEWDETTLVYTGSILHPTAKVVDENGNEVSGVTLIYGGDYYSSKWAGSYKVTVSVGNTSYFILSGSEVRLCHYARPWRREKASSRFGHDSDKDCYIRRIGTAALSRQDWYSPLCKKKL